MAIAKTAHIVILNLNKATSSPDFGMRIGRRLNSGEPSYDASIVAFGSAKVALVSVDVYKTVSAE